MAYILQIITFSNKSHTLKLYIFKTCKYEILTVMKNNSAYEGTRCLFFVIKYYVVWLWNASCVCTEIMLNFLDRNNNITRSVSKAKQSRAQRISGWNSLSNVCLCALRISNLRVYRRLKLPRSYPCSQLYCRLFQAEKQTFWSQMTSPGERLNVTPIASAHPSQVQTGHTHPPKVQTTVSYLYLLNDTF